MLPTKICGNNFIITLQENYKFFLVLGATLEKVWLTYLGRFIFGIGGESLAVAQNTYAVVWFKEKELNLVFGLQLSMARIVSLYFINFCNCC